MTQNIAHAEAMNRMQESLDRVTRERDTAQRHLEALREALTLQPCHVTGMHDPTHTTKRGPCSEQLAAMAKRAVAVLGDPNELPRALHGEECYWCHYVPSTRKDRDRQIEIHRWAGVEPPAALFEIAMDEVRPDDDVKAVWVLQRTTPDARMGDGFVTWQRATAKAGKDGGWYQFFPEDGMSSDRWWAIVRTLAEKGVIEHRDISVRLTEWDTWPGVFVERYLDFRDAHRDIDPKLVDTV